MISPERITIMVVVGVINWLVGYYFGHKDGWKYRIDYDNEEAEKKAKYMEKWQ